MGRTAGWSSFAVGWLLAITLSSCNSNDPGNHQATEPIPVQAGQFGTATLSFNNGGVCYPIDRKEAAPVVFFMEGWRFNENVPAVTKRYRTLIQSIASHGYTVIYTRDRNLLNPYEYAYELFDIAIAFDEIAIDKTRLGFIGHSSGGGHVFSIALSFLDTQPSEYQWGTNGSFIFSMAPWFAYKASRNGDNNARLSMQPGDFQVFSQFGTNLVIQEYQEDFETDPRIPITLQKMIAAKVGLSHRDFQILPGNHYIMADYEGPENLKTPNSINKMQAVLKPLHALMRYSFKHDGSAWDIALNQGTDKPDTHFRKSPFSADDYEYLCDDPNSKPVDLDYCSSGSK